MFDSGSRPLTGVDTAVDQLLSLTHAIDPWSASSPAELMAALERIQQLSNLACAAEQSLLAHAIADDTFESFGATSSANLLAHRLHLNPTAAHLRVRRAQRAEPRTTLTGELLPPKHEQLADAQTAGAVSGVHVDVVTRWLLRIEPHCGLQQYARAESDLVTLASNASPDAVAARGRELLQADCTPAGPVWNWTPTVPNPATSNAAAGWSPGNVRTGPAAWTGPR